MDRDFKKELILTIGVSGSGKSTFAEQYVKDNNNYVEINRDNIRFNLFTNSERNWGKYKFNRTNESKVTVVQEQLIFKAMAVGASIIISDTNINPAIREKFQLLAREHGYKYSEVLFPIKWEDVVKRNAQRQGGLPEHRIWDQYKKYMRQFGMVGEHKLEVYKEDPTLPHTIWVDIDGCVAEMEDRKPFEWDKVSGDHPRHQIIDMVYGRALRVGHITFMSGRDGCCYDDTKAWIEQHIMDSTTDNIKWELHLREEGDWRKDDVVKYEMFNEHIRGKYNVDCAFDDRYSVIRLESLLGIPNVIQVGEYFNEF